MENTACRQFILGVLVIAGVPYKTVRSRFHVSKSYYYSTRAYASNLLEALFGVERKAHKIILVTDEFVIRCVMCLSLYCRAPIEGIVSFFDLVIGRHVSKGAIDRIRKRAAEKAAVFDASIPLYTIQDIATDEIFQQGNPVLTGIDLKTDYAFLLDGAEDRSGETWAKNLQAQKRRGLAPALNVSDGGRGLLKGVEQVFPEIAQQADVFHMLRALGKEVHSVEMHASSELKKYCSAEYSVFYRKRGKPCRNAGNTYWKLHREIDGILAQADEVVILMGWLRETVGFAGYGYEKSAALCEWILDEMAQRFPERRKYQEAIRSFRAHLKELLSFLQRLLVHMEQRAKEYPSITGHDFMLLYQQKYTASQKEWEYMEKRLYRRFGRRLPEAREALEEMLRTARRASSMIENLNGRLRCFMDLKREIPEYFLILIKVFFNTKKQKRSRRENWKGTSALDRLTGKNNPEFLDIVAAPMNYAF